MKIRVMLVDDHALLRDALCMLLEGAVDIEVVAAVESGQRLLTCIQQAQPAVVGIDLNMPGLNGVELTRQLRQAYPQVKVLGLSAHADLPLVAEICKAGAVGYVVKGRAGAELTDAIRQVNMLRPQGFGVATVW